MRRRSYILAKFLRDEHHVGKKGDILLCYMPNSIHYPIVFLAGALLGASQTGINPEFTSCIPLNLFVIPMFNLDELAEYIKKTACTCIFTTSELLDKVSQALKGSNVSHLERA